MQTQYFSRVNSDFNLSLTLPIDRLPLGVSCIEGTGQHMGVGFLPIMWIPGTTHSKLGG